MTCSIDLVRLINDPHVFRYHHDVFEPRTTDGYDVNRHVVGVHDRLRLRALVTVQKRFGRRRVREKSRRRRTRDRWFRQDDGKVLKPVLH